MSSVTEAADVIDRFLKNEVVQGVFAGVREDIYGKFLHARDDTERREVHALAHALDRLETALRAVAQAGERERMDEEIAERRLATR